MGISTVNAPAKALLSQSELVARLKRIGEERYHHRHPFHLLMHEGKLTRGQLQAWALNRYCYQSRIPIKDAIILSRSDDMDFRRAWRKRIIDHDGEDGRPGGIEKWLRLAEATGLDRQKVARGEGVLPAVKYAVDAYVRWVTERSFLEAILRPDFRKPRQTRSLLSIGCSGTPKLRSSKNSLWAPCEQNATSFGPNSTPSISLTCSRDGLLRVRSALRNRSESS